MLSPGDVESGDVAPGGLVVEPEEVVDGRGDDVDTVVLLVVGEAVVLVVVGEAVVLVVVGDAVVLVVVGDAVVLVVVGAAVVLVVVVLVVVTVNTAEAELVPWPTELAPTAWDPTAAPAGTVRLTENAPAPSVLTFPVPESSQRIWRISSGANPPPETTYTVPGGPLVGLRLISGAADASGVTNRTKPMTTIGIHQRRLEGILRARLPERA